MRVLLCAQSLVPRACRHFVVVLWCLGNPLFTAFLDREAVPVHHVDCTAVWFGRTARHYFKTVGMMYTVSMDDMYVDTRIEEVLPAVEFAHNGLCKFAKCGTCTKLRQLSLLSVERRSGGDRPRAVLGQ